MPTVTTTVTSAAACGVTTTVTTTEATAPAVETLPEARLEAAPLKPLGEIVATGFHFGEGPRFHNGKLYMSDFCGFEPGTHESGSNGALGDHGFIWEVSVTVSISYNVEKIKVAIKLHC